MMESSHRLFREPAPAPYKKEGDRFPYGDTVTALARLVVYGNQTRENIAAKEIERRITVAQQNPAFAEMESETHELERLRHLLRGIEAHERTNLVNDAWQETLVRQPGRALDKKKPPEELTRAEVGAMFAAFPERERQLDAEQTAIEQYESFLSLGHLEGIRLTDRITIQLTDIEVLINDLRVRSAERNPNDEERGAELAKLDQALIEIIDRVPDEEDGKRFELEELFLLRRLIHDADTGHVASVSHGTIREDLRPDRGSVDIEISAAGDRMGFQLKTLRIGVSDADRRAAHYDVIKRAESHLSEGVYFVVLDSLAVQRSYENALHELKGLKAPKRGEKFETLKPLTDALSPQERAKLLTALHFSEEELAEEQVLFDAKAEERRAFETEYLAKQREREERESAVIQAREDAVRQAEEELRMRHELHAQRQLDAVAASQRERDIIAQAKTQRLAEQQHARQVERIAAAKRAVVLATEEANRAAEVAAKERRRKEREEREKNAPDWPPKSLLNLGTAPVLLNIGLLPPDWKGDASQFVAAKKQFITLFAKPKSKAPATDKDKPNDFFAEVFTDKKRWESPSDEEKEEMRQRLQSGRSAAA